MSTPSVTLEGVDDETVPDVERLLEENDLPSRDVHSKPDCFYVAVDGGDRIGIVGLETDGTDGLLRSLVVEQSARGAGYGTAICVALETTARAQGVETLYLLTTTAAEFFVGRGYVELERSDAPDAIRATTEFDDLCPATATCLKKRL